MLLEYRIRINLLIVVKKTVLQWYTGEVDMVEDKDIRFHTGSSHLSKRLAIQLVGHEGVYMVCNLISKPHLG